MHVEAEIVARHRTWDGPPLWDACGPRRRSLGRLPCRDFLQGPEQQHRPANVDLITRAKPPNLNWRAVDPRAVSALQIGQNDVAVFLLNLGVKSTDALVIEAQ